MAKRKEAWWEQGIPARYARIYLDIARERGADSVAVLRDIGLSQEAVSHPNAEISFLHMFKLVDSVLQRVGNDGIGIDAGLKMPPTVFGNLGYALLCSETLRDVMELCFRFWPLLGRGIHVEMQQDGEMCVIALSHLIPVPDPHQQLSMEVTVASFYRGLQVLASPKPEQIEIHLRAPEPPYADKVYRALGNVQFAMPHNQFRFHQSLLDVRLPMHNPQGRHFAIEQCERELALLNTDSFGLGARVQEKLVQGVNGYPSLDDIANQFHMTSRTLRRRLEEEGANFKSLLEDVKQRDAMRLLDDRRLDIQRIAGLLGYQDPANFTRAFRQWTGQTPTQYRQARDSSV